MKNLYFLTAEQRELFSESELPMSDLVPSRIDDTITPQMKSIIMVAHTNRAAQIVFLRHPASNLIRRLFAFPKGKVVYETQGDHNHTPSMVLGCELVNRDTAVFWDTDTSQGKDSTYKNLVTTIDALSKFYHNAEIVRMGIFRKLLNQPLILN